MVWIIQHFRIRSIFRINYHFSFRWINRITSFVHYMIDWTSSISPETFLVVFTLFTLEVVSSSSNRVSSSSGTLVVELVAMIQRTTTYLWRTLIGGHECRGQFEHLDGNMSLHNGWTLNPKPCATNVYSAAQTPWGVEACVLKSVSQATPRPVIGNGSIKHQADVSGLTVSEPHMP